MPKVEARRLWEEFDRDSDRADKRYKNKRLLITGKVAALHESNAWGPEPAINLHTGHRSDIDNDEWVVVGALLESERDRLDDLDLGERVTLECTCRDASFSTVELDNCSVVKPVRKVLTHASSADPPRMSQDAALDACASLLSTIVRGVHAPRGKEKRWWAKIRTPMQACLRDVGDSQQGTEYCAVTVDVQPFMGACEREMLLPPPKAAKEFDCLFAGIGNVIKAASPAEALQVLCATVCADKSLTASLFVEGVPPGKCSEFCPAQGRCRAPSARRP